MASYKCAWLVSQLKPFKTTPSERQLRVHIADLVLLSMQRDVTHVHKLESSKSIGFQLG